MIRDPTSAGQTASVRLEPPWLPTSPVRRVLAAARRHYHSARVVDRPSLRDPSGYAGLFPLHDLRTLAKCGYWPLPPRALDWLSEPPAERAQRQRRVRQGVRREVVRLLAKHLPGAVEALVKRALRQEGH
jgi:hypothetical protein